MWVYGLDWAGLGQRQVADACECGNEPSGSVKYGEFLDQLQTSQLLKKDSAPWSKYQQTNNCPVTTLLGTFSKLQKKGLLVSSCLVLSVRKEQLGSHWTDIHET